MTNRRRKTKPVCLKIVGLILSESYQRSKLFAERLHKHHGTKFLKPSITGMLDMDWTDYIEKLRKEIGGRAWSVLDSVVVFMDGSFVGSEADFFRQFRDFLYKNPSSEKLKEHAEKEYRQYLDRGNLVYTFMELTLGGQYMGTLLFQLRYDMVPNSTMWFTEFCTHERFSYRGTKIQRVCKRGWFQSGELLCQREWSLQCLSDENYCYKHDRRGILSFANEGRHTNQFQFFVTFGPADWMDGKYVAFGRVIEGSEVLRRIECTPCTYEKPDIDIVIKNCGLAKVGLGKAIDPSARLKGITIGQPHIHMEFFIDFIFDKFDQALYERLDEEVKKLIEGKWVFEMIWDKMMEVMRTKRPPTEDVLDVRDEDSSIYLAERYFAGLYSLPDIPDLFIRKLLDEAIRQAIESIEIKLIAESVANFLVNSAFDAVVTREQVVNEIVHSLMKDLFRTIFGSEETLNKDSFYSAIGIHKKLSRDSYYLKKSLSDLKKTVGLGADVSKAQLSRKESVAAFIWGILLEILNSLNGKLV